MVTFTLTVAQNNTSSPYTRYGLGLLEKNTFGRGQALGGSGIALRSNKTINRANPASFSAIDTLSQIFEFGLTGQIARLESGANEQYNNDVNFSYIGLAFPISKNIGLSLGVKPMSNVGYAYMLEDDKPNIGMTTNYYNGYGGVSEAFIGVSGNVFENLSLGVNLSYLFGSIVHQRILEFTENTDFANFSSEEKISVNAVHPIFGVQYLLPLSESSSLLFGSVYELKTSLNAKQNFSSTKEVVGVLESVTGRDIGFEMPEAYGVGLTYEIKNKLTITSDYYIQNWGDSKYYNVTDTLQNTARLSGGIEYIPNYIDRNYFKRIEYRVGGYYSNSYLKGLGSDLYNFGMTFGLGLPLRYEKTRFNIGLELGQMKSSNSSLISESYGKLTINFSFNDFWFMRRKLE